MESDGGHENDAYGFPLTVGPEQQAVLKACRNTSQKRAARDWARDAPTADKRGPLKRRFRRSLKKSCRKGVPPYLRSIVWFATSGAANKSAQYEPKHFENSVRNALRKSNQCHVRQIDLDVRRTFPEHPFFRKDEGLAKLRAVLLGYAGHNPEVGYCQSMNYVAGLLLLVLERDAERTFWVLSALLEDRLARDTYDEQVSGCHVEVRVFEQLLARKQPALAAHLRSCDVSLIAVVVQWFLSLFTQSCPMETVVRIFDSLLLEGSKVVHRVGLALFQAAEPQLMRARDTLEVAQALKEVSCAAHDRDTLMRAATQRIGSLSRRTIEKLRAEARTDMGFTDKSKQSLNSSSSSISGKNNKISSSPRAEAAAAALRNTPTPPVSRGSPAAAAAIPAQPAAPSSPVRGRLLPDIVTGDSSSSPAADARRKLATRRPPSGRTPRKAKVEREKGIGGRDVNGVDLDVYDGGVTGGSSTRHVFRAGLDTLTQHTPRNADAAGADGNPLGGGASISDRRRRDDRVPAEVLDGDVSFLGEEASQVSSFWERTRPSTEGAPAPAGGSSRFSAGFTNGWTQPALGTSVGLFTAHPAGSSGRGAGASAMSAHDASNGGARAEVAMEASASGRLELEVLADAPAPVTEAPTCSRIPPAPNAAASPRSEGPRSLSKRMSWLSGRASGNATNKSPARPLSIGSLLRGASRRANAGEQPAEPPAGPPAGAALPIVGRPKTVDPAALSAASARVQTGPRSDGLYRKGMAWRQQES